MGSPKYTQIQYNLQLAFREIEGAIRTIESRGDCGDMLQGLLSIRGEIEYVFNLALNYDGRVDEQSCMQGVKEEKSEGSLMTKEEMHTYLSDMFTFLISVRAESPEEEKLVSDLIARTTKLARSVYWFYNKGDN
jgi:DNA-binding FrmR family transcriptional regulator